MASWDLCHGFQHAALKPGTASPRDRNLAIHRFRNENLSIKLFEQAQLPDTGEIYDW